MTPKELDLDLEETPTGAAWEGELRLEEDLERAFDQMEATEYVELPAEEMAEWVELGLTPSARS